MLFWGIFQEKRRVKLWYSKASKFGKRTFSSRGDAVLSIFESDSRSLSHSGMYKSFFEHHPDAVYILDLNGQFLDINPTALAISGYTREEFMELSFRQIVVPRYLERAEQCFRETRGGVPQSYCTSIFHRNGFELPLFVTTTPIEQNGAVIGVFGIAKDLTEHNQITEQLNQAKTQLEVFVDDNIDAIGFFTLDGITVKINRAYEEMFGWPAEELIGRDITLLPIIPPNEQQQVRDMQKAAAKGQPSLKRETVRMTRDGRELRVLLSVTPMVPVGQYAVTIKDVTELATAQSMLRQTEKLSVVGKLAAGVAHEIRNPLTALKGFTQLLHKKSRGDNRRYFDIMQSELNRIDSILGELLVLAKPQALAFRPRDVEMILHEVISLMNTEAIMKNIVIEPTFENTATIATVNCEGNQLKQVFINIIKNGIDAMPSGGHLLIRTKVECETVSILFTDEGDGIPEEQIRLLGEPFFTTKSKGTGLGLMVTQKIISAHQGQMEIESEVGKGTTVRIKLPLLTNIDPES